MSADERRLDGNAIGGLLHEVFGVEMTVSTSVCSACGAAEEIARLHVYVDAPGAVVRCSHCEAVLMCVVRAPGRTFLSLRGLRTLTIEHR